jgi:hypothetical protein
MAILHWISTMTGRIIRAFAGRYRPERHYMRGAGPATKRSQSVGCRRKKAPENRSLLL